MKENRDKLWITVTTQCVPGYVDNGNPAPCVSVDTQNNFVIYKVDGSVNHFLLLPITRITGTEDKKFLREKMVFFHAWENRFHLDNERLKNGDCCLLSVNSLINRTQDQLHIHITFLSDGAKKILKKTESTLLEGCWSIRPIVILEQSLFLKKITHSMFSSGKLNFSFEARELSRLHNKNEDGLVMGVTSVMSDYFILMAGFCEEDSKVSVEILGDEFSG